MTNSTIQKTNLPTVSVIVPTYNRAQILAETINAILKQTYRDFELIIISDGSNDGTSDKARQYQNIDQRVRYYEISHTGRPAPARNYGIKKARGEFLAFCDDDDIWMPQKLEKQIRTMRQRPEFGLCYTYRITKTANSEHIFPYKFRAGNVFKKLFTSTNFITNSSVLIRSSILRNLELRGGGGYLTNCRK